MGKASIDDLHDFFLALDEIVPNIKGYIDKRDYLDLSSVNCKLIDLDCEVSPLLNLCCRLFLNNIWLFMNYLGKHKTVEFILVNLKQLLKWESLGLLLVDSLSVLQVQAECWIVQYLVLKC